ncbi:MAG: hypothetical protein Q9168_002266 [Polycauliona sp. 1 TL-2023]
MEPRFGKHKLDLQSKNDPERAIKLYNLLSKYRGKVSPRPSQAPTPNNPATPQSEAAPSPAVNQDHGPAEGSRLHPEPWKSELSTQSPGSRQHIHNSDVPSPGPKNDAHSSGLLSPPTPNGNGYFETGAYSSEDPFLDWNTGEKSPGKEVQAEPNNIQSESIDYDLPTARKDELEWNCVLPVIQTPIHKLRPGETEGLETFNCRDLVGSMQNGASQQTVQNYLERFDRAQVRESINEEIDGFPAMFFVVETNKEELLRTWVAHGGNSTAVHRQSGIPLLAFAIMHSENMQTDSTLMTATLLSLGASPSVIPSAFFLPYIQDLPETGPNEASLKDLSDENKKWCKGAARGKLARTATLSQRYHLERAAKTKRASVRQTQVAQKRNAEPLLGIANFLVGQTMAAKMLLDKLLSHLTVPNKKPLVLVFAGPSGHGKTELARHLGSLLSLQLDVVDCTIFNREIELFGPRQPYLGWDKGSRLNNFLASNHEKRCIVFLDEFEKTNSDIHKTLLLPFDNGEYQDRRNQDKINCSRTIWILATNAHDPVIQDFSANNSRALFIDDDESEKEGLLKQLSKQIKQDFLAHHGPPVTGRISAFIPFLPFSKGEQAVIIHKHLLEFGRNIRTPISLTEGDGEQLIGNVRLRIRRDASVCGILAQAEYHVDLGARSLISAVDTIKTLMVEAYLGVDEEITEGGGMSEFIIDVNGGEVVANIIPPQMR